VANIEEKTRKVLEALLQCSKVPFNLEECKDCPYAEEKPCISNMCRDAYSVIVTLDTTINAMMGEYGDSCDAEGCGSDGGEG
jgi:hypothetical protein